jgi:hypothetical protein
VDKDWSTIDDLSNCSTMDFYHKLDSVGPDLRSCNLFHIDIIPRHIHRKSILTLSKSVWITAEVVITALLLELSTYWLDVAESAIRDSRALIIINTGEAAVAAYERYARSTGRILEKVWMRGPKIGRTPDGWLEYVNAAKKTVRRLVLDVYHSEYVNRMRGKEKNPTQHLLAVQERLIDAAMVYLFGGPTLPAFLSSVQYVRPAGFSLALPLYVIEDCVNGKNDNLIGRLTPSNPYQNQILKLVDSCESINNEAARTNINKARDTARLSLAAFERHVLSPLFDRQHGRMAVTFRLKMLQCPAQPRLL